MQIAVADVPEPDDLKIRVVLADDSIDIVQESRHLADRHGDIVLVGRPVGDGFRDEFAQLPQILQLLVALAHHAVNHPALLDAVLECRQRFVGYILVQRLKLQQGVERAIRLERRRHIAPAHDLGHRLVGKKLEGGQIQLALERVQHRHDGIEIRRAQDHRGEVLRRPLQAHGRFNNKAQRAFGADKQLAQIIAGGVLDQVLVQLQELAGTGHDFQASHPVARHAITDDLDAARVGADVAADIA